MPRLFLIVALVLGTALAASAQLRSVAPERDPELVYYSQVLARTGLVAFYPLDDGQLGPLGVADDLTNTDDGAYQLTGSLTTEDGLAPKTADGAIGFAGGYIDGLAEINLDQDWSVIVWLRPSLSMDGNILSTDDRNVLRFDNASFGFFFNWGSGDGTQVIDAFQPTAGIRNQIGLSYREDDVGDSDSLIVFWQGEPVDTLLATIPDLDAGAWKIGRNAGNTTSGDQFAADAFQIYDQQIGDDVYRQDYLQSVGAYEYSTQSVPSLLKPWGVQTKLTNEADYCLNLSNRLADSDYALGDLTVELTANTPGPHCALVGDFLCFSPSAGEYTPADGKGCELTTTNPGGGERIDQIGINFRTDPGAADLTVSDQPALVAEGLTLAAAGADSLGVIRLRETYYPGTQGHGLTFMFIQDASREIIHRWAFPAGPTTSKSETTTIGRDEGARYQTACAPIVPGTLTATITATNAGANPYTEVVADSAYMGGVYMGDKSDWRPGVLYREGQISFDFDDGFKPEAKLAAHIGGTTTSDWSASMQVDYECADTDFMWVAVADASGTPVDSLTTLYARDFGALTHDEVPYFNSSHAIVNAHYVAQQRVEDKTKFQFNHITDVKLTDLTCPEHGGAGCEGATYWYDRTIQNADGAFTSGSRGPVVVDSTFNTFDKGWTEAPGWNETRPVIVVPDSVTWLKVLPPPGTPGCDHCRGYLDTRAMVEDFADPDHLAPDVAALTSTDYVVVQAVSGAETFNCVRDLALDGSLDEHKEHIYTSGTYPDAWHTSTGQSNVFQQTPGGTGCTKSVQNGHVVHKKQRLLVERAAVQNFPGSNILSFSAGAVKRSNPNILRSVLVGPSGSSHSIYMYERTIADTLQFEGGAWGHGVFSGLDARNVTVTNLHQGFRCPGESQIFQYRGQAHRDSVAAMPREAYEDGWTHTGPFRIDGLLAVLDGANEPSAAGGHHCDADKVQLIALGGPHLEITDALIVQDDEAAMALTNTKGDDITKGVRYKAPIFRDIDVILGDADSETETFVGPNTYDQGIYEDINFFDNAAGTSSSGNDFERCLYVPTRRGSQTGGTAPMWNVFSDIGGTSDHAGMTAAPLRCGQLLRTNVSGNGKTNGGEARTFIIDSRFDNSSGLLMTSQEAGQGRLQDVCPTDGSGTTDWPGVGCQAVDRLPTFMRNVDLNTNGSNTPGQHLLAAVARLDNVTDEGAGLASEHTGTHVCTGGSSFEYDPDILWVPHPTRGSVTITGPGVDSYSFSVGNDDDVSISDTQYGIVDPMLNVELTSACTPGQEYTIEIEVSAWEGGVTVPTEPDESVFEVEVAGGDWEWVPVPAMECRDGSQNAGYFIRQAVSPAGVVVWLYGGGAGWDAGSYFATPYSADLASQVEDLVSRDEAGGGIFDFDNADNELQDYTIVLVPYCTGDIHGGSKADHDPGYPDRDGLWPQVGVQQHVGGDNIDHLLDALDLEEQSPWATVFFGGSSAGACGVIAKYDDVATHFAPQAVHGIMDACILPEDDDALAPEVQADWHETWELRIPAGCPTDDSASSCKTSTGDGMSNILPFVASEYPGARFALLSCLPDYVFQFFFSHTGGCERGCGGVDGEVLAQATLDWTATFPASVYTYLIPNSCHTILQNGKAYTTSIEGTTPMEWLGGFLNDTATDIGP